MLIKTNYTGNYAEDPIKFLGLETYDDGVADHALYIGAQGPNPRLAETNSRLCLEMPIAVHDISSYYSYDRVYNLCPITSAFLNKQCGRNLFRPIFFPTNPDYVQAVPLEKRDIDVIYTGSTNFPNWPEALAAVAKYNYCGVSYQSGPGVTHPNLSYKDKMKMVGRSKITICHNILYAQPGHPIPEGNPAFNFVRSTNLYPQIKSRMFEAAFSKSIMLVREDQWNMVEQFFGPHHLKWKDPEDLSKIVKQILENYAYYYYNIAVPAYQVAVENYSSASLMNKIMEKD